MKLTDVVNESLSGFIDTFTPEQKERLYKKARTIFKVFKKGTITRSDGVSFSYELGDYMRPRIDDEGDLELFASVQTMTELTWCPINHEWMTKLVEEKFKKMFGINIELTPPRESNLVKWTGKKPWDKEEPTELNEESPNDPITDKERKKIRAVYSALKTGVFDYDYYPGKVRYVLQDEYDIERGPNTGRAIIVLLGNARDVCKLYKVNDDGSTGVYLRVDIQESLYNMASKIIEERFMNFDLKIIF